MPTKFRSYQPDQALLLPPSLRDWLPEGHIANHVSDLVDGSGFVGILRALRRGRSAQVALRAADDGEAFALRICDGSVLVPKDRAQAGRRCGVSGAGGGQLSESSDDLRVSPPTFGGFQEAVCGGGWLGAGVGVGPFWEAVD